MQLEDAMELKKNWSGGHCSHPKLVKEYFLGADTQDFICTTCGEAFTRKEKEEIESERKK